MDKTLLIDLKAEEVIGLLHKAKPEIFDGMVPGDLRNVTLVREKDGSTIGTFGNEIFMRIELFVENLGVLRTTPEPTAIPPGPVNRNH